MQFDKISDITTYVIEVKREPGLHMGRPPVVNESGYIVDFDNGTLYPANDRTLIIKIVCETGRVGWGETYGITAPGVVAELIRDVIRPCLIGRDPTDVKAIWRSLYNMMRVRGYTTGFWLDAIAAVDIALWDLTGKIFNVPVHKLLGSGGRNRLAYYITNVAGASAQDKFAALSDMYQRGERSFKIHAASSFSFIDLLRQVRSSFSDVELMLDLHWNYTAAEALAISKQVEDLNILFIEAPCQYEDLSGLKQVAAASSVAIAVGEEWRTIYDARPRLHDTGIGVIQPEMGRTGITQFSKICDLADLYHCRVMPHATIGFGIFMAASVHASLAHDRVVKHELQNTMFNRHLHMFDTEMRIESGHYVVSDAPGLGIEPNSELWHYATEL